MSSSWNIEFIHGDHDRSCSERNHVEKQFIQEALFDFLDYANNHCIIKRMLSIIGICHPDDFIATGYLMKFNLNYQGHGESTIKAILVNKYFLTWLLIGWRLSQVWKMMSVIMAFNIYFSSGDGPILTYSTHISSNVWDCEICYLN